MEKEELKKIITEFPIFSNLDDPNLTRLAENAVVSDIPKKAIYFSEAKFLKGMHVLLSGKVKLFKLAEDGKEQTIFVFGPGEPFCLCSTFSDGKMPANLSALEDSKVLFISPSKFQTLIQEDPSILLNMMSVMAKRLKDAMVMIDSLSLKQIPSRLAAYFLSQSEEGWLKLGISYRELSKIIGVTPEALSRAMKKMSKEKLIEVDGTSVRLINKERLETCRDGNLLC
ncbi:Crp/Fnr family transcriptional regulator [Desulfovibrio gilichinskyi]|uniref:CRP/FNR family transcriptional regulator, anaerobic regulatory protein n=1 Tax=Desulfovibrio gilichinskyi TaxID=1519643 RepID=A0A1X7EK39_9BACT|nr:Crp/Fnr family transcriptional regulator [Desulfovibrio gilichinskyi]SMF35297.1 CRP/FNR family transcriptional regulator, anaerobic regulatory protein [Desulfovibrio gilichinskyi]